LSFRYPVACGGDFHSLIQAGVDPSKIEMWHHLVDGNEKAGNFMDWAFMDDYVKKNRPCLWHSRLQQLVEIWL